MNELDRRRETRMLATEVKLLKEVLHQRETRLKEICDHEKIKRGDDSLYYSPDPFTADACGMKHYTYECLDCGQHFSLDKPYEKFEKRADETLKNG